MKKRKDLINKERKVLADWIQFNKVLFQSKRIINKINLLKQYSNKISKSNKNNCMDWLRIILILNLH